MGTYGADGASGATGYLPKDQRVLWPVFVSLGKGKARREKELAVQVVECIGERYELQDAEMGKVLQVVPCHRHSRMWLR